MENNLFDKENLLLSFNGIIVKIGLENIFKILKFTKIPYDFNPAEKTIDKIVLFGCF